MGRPRAENMRLLLTKPRPIPNSTTSQNKNFSTVARVRAQARYNDNIVSYPTQLVAEQLNRHPAYYSMEMSNSQKIVMVNVPKLDANKSPESKDSLLNKSIHRIRHVRGCRSVIRVDIVKAHRLVATANPLDSIKHSMARADLAEKLFALEFRTSAPGQSAIQFRRSPRSSVNVCSHEHNLTRLRGVSTLENRLTWGGIG